MRISVASEDQQGLDAQVGMHFGRCPFFTFVNVEGHEIQQVEVVANPFYTTHQPGQVPGFIHQQGGQMMIAGGMGGRAVSFFEQFGIQAFTGSMGTVKEAVELALGGELDVAAGCAGHSGGNCEDHDHHHGHA